MRTRCYVNVGVTHTGKLIFIDHRVDAFHWS